MASPTTAQEEAKSPKPPAKPSHGRHENGAEERAGYRETDHRGVAATPHLTGGSTDMTNTQQTTTSTAETEPAIRRHR